MTTTVRFALLIALLTPATVAVQAPAATPPRGTTALDVFAHDDVVDLLVAVDAGDGFRLEHRRSRDYGRTFGDPVVIAPATGRLTTPGRNTDPQIAARGDRLVAAWTAPGTSAWGGGPLLTAISSDGGRTWQAGPSPDDQGQAIEQAFIDLTDDDAGRLHAVWLDSRGGRMGLRSAVSNDWGQRWSANGTIDTVTCECCWNILARGWGGSLLALYRDVPRDMAVARTTGNGWARSATVAPFNWGAELCPDVGGALVRGTGADTLHALVWTGEEAARGLYVASSSDNGATWRPPVRVGSADAWHGDLTRSGDTLLAAWDVNTPNDVHIEWAWSVDAGRTWSTGGRLTPPGVRATHPKVTPTPDGAMVYWTERAGGVASRWRADAVRPR